MLGMALQEKLRTVLTLLCKLLDLSYYDVFELVCDFIKATVARRPTLFAPEAPQVATALVTSYNTLPVEESAALVKAVESTLDAMANCVDAHVMMQAWRCPMFSSDAFGCAQAQHVRRAAMSNSQCAL